MQFAQRFARAALAAVLMTSLGNASPAPAAEPSCGEPKHASAAMTAAKMNRREMRAVHQAQRRAKREAQRRAPSAAGRADARDGSAS